MLRALLLLLQLGAVRQGGFLLYVIIEGSSPAGELPSFVVFIMRASGGGRKPSIPVHVLQRCVRLFGTLVHPAV